MQDPKSPSNMGNENRGGGTATSDQSRDGSSAIQQNGHEYLDKASEYQDDASGTASENQDDASGKVAEYGAKLQETADAGIDRAAGGLEKAAEQLRSHAEEGGGVQKKVAVRVADGMDKSSQYLRDHEAQEIWTDVEQFVKDHPLQAAATAAVAGYVVAKLMK